MESSGSIDVFHDSANAFKSISTGADIDSPRDKDKTVDRVPFIITWKWEGPKWPFVVK